MPMERSIYSISANLTKEYYRLLKELTLLWDAILTNMLSLLTVSSAVLE